MIKKNPEQAKADINQEQVIQKEQQTPKESVSKNDTTSTTKGDQQVHQNDIVKDKITSSWTSKITILLPRWISVSAFHELRKDIYKEKKIRANIIVAENQNDYTKKLQAQLIKPTADIILLPTTYVKSFLDRWVHIPFKYSITWFFHTSFQSLIESKQASFIPFALDPLVLWYKKDIFPNSLPLTFADLQSKLLTFPENTPFPFVFGISANDVSFLEQHKTPYPQYFWFLHIILEQAKINKSTYLIDFFMKIHTRDSEKISLYAKEKDTPWCKDEARLCLLATKDIINTPWRMSDAWYIKNLFQKDIKEQYSFNNFPLITKQYPVQWWGFLINQKSPNITAAWERIKSYLDHAEQNDGSLRNSTFSAFNTHFQRQKIETQYASLQEFFKYFILFQGSLDDNQKLIEQSHFLDMLRGNWSKIIFLKEEIEK